MKIRTIMPNIFFQCLAVALAFILMAVNAIAGPGAVDTTFNVIANNTVYSLLTLPNGKVLVGGSFTQIGGVQRNGLARLFPDGTVDLSFTNILFGGGAVYAMLLQPNGKLLIAGNLGTSGFPERINVARLNQDGSVDGTFTNSNPIGTVFALALQTDGKVLIGGQFTQVGNSNHFYIARVNADGTVDNTFNPGSISGNTVNAIAVQPDGNILVGGSFNSFTTYGLGRQNIARLLTNGIPDLTYQASASSPVQAVYLQPDGKSVWAGTFTTLDNSSKARVGRLNADGTLDPSFTPSSGINSTIYDVAEDNNGNIYVGGIFSAYNNTIREGVARLFADGTLDSTFNNTTNFVTPTVRAIALQDDGKVLAGGTFFTYNSSGRTNLVRLYGDNYPAEIVTQPQSRNIGVGSNVTFTVDVSNPTEVSYQWYKDGEEIPGANFNEYSVFGTQLPDSGKYSVFVSTGFGGTTSSNAVLQVGIPVAITQQPTNLTVIAGQTAAFTVTATGTPLNYAWNFGHAVIGTNATLTVPNVTLAQAGNYFVVVSNFLNSTNSAQVTLTVLVPITNVIVSPSPSEFVPVGGTATFSVSATGNPKNYQWLNGGNPIPGANAASYSITNVQSSNDGQFSVIISNQLNSVTSSIVTLTVGSPPSFTVQPSSVTNNLGDTVAFTAMANGDQPITYQWLLNGIPLTGQNGTNLSLTNVQLANIGIYALSASNAFGGAVSSNALLNVNGYPFNLYSGLVAYYPFSGNANDISGNGYNGVINGATLTPDRFGTPGMAYQFDGVTNSITCNITNIPFAGSSRTVSLWAKANLTALSTTDLIWWGARQALSGFAVANDGGPFTWQGEAFGAGGYADSGIVVDTNWHQIVVEYTNSLLSISLDGVLETVQPVSINTSFTPMQIGSGPGTAYFPGAIDEVRVYNRALSTNDVQQLYLLEVGQPTITQQPQSLAVIAGTTANFNVQAIGAGTLSYQWYYSNAPVANATNAMLTVPSVQASNSGAYYAVVSNSFGATPSSVATLSVGQAPQTVQLLVGSNQSVTLQMAGTAGFNYVLQMATNLVPPVQWQNVGSISTGSNGVWTFTDTNPPAAGARFYRVSSP